MLTARVIVREDLAIPAPLLQRVLVATDFSDVARAALDCAQGIAQGFRSKLFLVHAIPTGALHYVSPESIEQAMQQARIFAGRRMQQLAEQTGCTGGVQEEVLCGGGVWPQLQKFIRAQAIDLLVLGTHGSDASKKALLGPVAEEIFRLAECPVLTVGAPGEKPARAGGGIRRILYATNFKPHAERAARFAYAMERALQAQLTILHVVEDQQDFAQPENEIVREFLVKRMRKSRPSAIDGKQEPTFRVRFGEASEQILQQAREEASDLIILGLRSAKDVAGELPSAVAYKLVCQAPCPVLTTRN